MLKRPAPDLTDNAKRSRYSHDDITIRVNHDQNHLTYIGHLNVKIDPNTGQKTIPHGAYLGDITIDRFNETGQEALTKATYYPNLGSNKYDITSLVTAYHATVPQIAEELFAQGHNPDDLDLSYEYSARNVMNSPFHYATYHGTAQDMESLIDFHQRLFEMSENPDKQTLLHYTLNEAGRGELPRNERHAHIHTATTIMERGQFLSQLEQDSLSEDSREIYEELLGNIGAKATIEAADIAMNPNKFYDRNLAGLIGSYLTGTDAAKAKEAVEHYTNQQR